MKIDELRAKAKETGDKINLLAKAFEENGQKWKDDESRSAFNAAKAERESIEKDLAAEVAAEEEARGVADVLKGMKDFDEKTLSRQIPGREDRKYGEDPNKITEETRCLALAGWCLGENRTDEHREAMAACKISGARDLTVNGWDQRQYRRAVGEVRKTSSARVRQALEELAESRSMSSFIGATGGLITAPDTLIRSLEINMLAFGGVRQVATTFVTATGERTSLPTADDTSNTGFQLGENTDVSATTEALPTLTQIYWDAYDFSSGMIKVPYRLMRDSVFDLPSILGDMLGERLGRITATKHTTGTGANTAKGIVTCSTAGKTTSSATAINFDEIQDLIHSIDPAYRTGASFMMHDGIWLYLKKLKDGVARYFIQEDVTGVATPRLFGYPVYISQEMQSTVATGTKTMLFGQLDKHRIRRVNGVRLKRLSERYGEYDQEAFLAFLSEDSNAVTAGTQPFKHMLQA